MILMDGKALSARILEDLQHEIAGMAGQPGLAVVLVGDDPASRVYVRNKGKTCRALGMASFEHHLPATIPQDALLALIGRLNLDPAVHGILVQLPLPTHIDSGAVLAAVDPDKDVDGFHAVNVGRLHTGLPGLVPCTPAGCIRLLEHYVGPDLAGKHAVVVGRSNIVGKPVAALLLQKDCTVTIAHSRTKDLPALCRTADILVAAVGRSHMVRADWVKPGAIVIDVGINRMPDGTLAGDVDFAAVRDKVAAITPVPGGVGPMTIACLMDNTIKAAKAAQA